MHGYTFVIGTRAELIKMYPLIKEFDNRKIKYDFIHTGQHNLKSLCKDFDIKEPNIVLYKPPTKSSLFMNSITKALFWFFIGSINYLKYLLVSNNRIILTHGDTVSTLLGVLYPKVLFWKNYKTAHVEAGLRSRNIFEPFPEELVRRITDFLSDFKFVTTKDDLKHFKSKKGVYLTGNTIVDSIDDTISSKYKFEGKYPKEKLVLVSIHRYENITQKERLIKVLDIIQYAVKEGYNLVWPMHDNTYDKIVKYGFKNRLKGIKIVPPLSYKEFLNLSTKAEFLLADGGSIQEEGIYLKKVVFLLRKYTERNAGLKTKYNFLTYLDLDIFKKLYKQFKEDRLKGNDELVYGTPLVSKKVANILENR